MLNNVERVGRFCQYENLLCVLVHNKCNFYKIYDGNKIEIPEKLNIEFHHCG